MSESLKPYRVEPMDCVKRQITIQPYAVASVFVTITMTTDSNGRAWLTTRSCLNSDSDLGFAYSTAYADQCFICKNLDAMALWIGGAMLRISVDDAKEVCALFGLVDADRQG